MANPYDRIVVPRLVHWGMRSRHLLPWRAKTVGPAYGRVLELGIGSGLNFPHYGRTVDEVVGIEPSARLLRLAARAAAWMPFKIRLLKQSAEHLPFPDASFDCVVSTWCLCSIPDVEAALNEARRVLRPGGRFLFIEHGAAPCPKRRAWQNRLTPLWRVCSGGCHLAREPLVLIRNAGFELEMAEQGHFIDGPRLLTYHYRGQAGI